MKKLILTTLAGFVASFIFGSISYFLYYEKLMVALMEKYPASIKTEPDLMIGMGAGLVQSLLMAYSFNKMNFNTMKSGALNGIWFAGGIWMIANLNNLSMLSFYETSFVITDTVISAALGAFAGAAIGWTLDKQK